MTTTSSEISEPISLPSKKNSLSTDERCIIFTKRIKTMYFVAQSLNEVLNWKLIDKAQRAKIAIIHSTVSGMNFCKFVEDVGKERFNIRLLVASQVLSIHLVCKKLMQFDFPWSLIAFQQNIRRIFRYIPYFGYLLTISDPKRIKGEQWILKKRIDKYNNVRENFRKPTSLTSVHTTKTQQTKIQHIDYWQHLFPQHQIDTRVLVY